MLTMTTPKLKSEMLFLWLLKADKENLNPNPCNLCLLVKEGPGAGKAIWGLACESEAFSKLQQLQLAGNQALMCSEEPV